MTRTPQAQAGRNQHVRPGRKSIALAAALILALLAWTAALAQSGGGYDLSWWIAGGGGGSSNGARYELAGTAGQLAGPAMSGRAYSIDGGFWPGTGTTSPPRDERPVFLPFVVAN